MYSPSSDNFEAALGTPLVIIVKTDRIIQVQGKLILTMFCDCDNVCNVDFISYNR